MFNLSKLTDKQIDKAIKLTTILIIGSVVSFSIYYVYANYFAKSPTVTEKAITELEKQVQEKPDNASLRVRLAQRYFQNKQIDAAMDQYEQALKITPKLGDALVGVGLVYLQRDDTKKALEYFNKEIKNASKGEFADIDKNLENAYFYSGMIYLTDKKYDKAIGFFEKAIKIESAASDNHYYLGVALYETGKTKEAIKYLKNAVMFEPKFAQAHYYLGKAYEDSGNKKEAKKEYQKAVDSQTNYKEAKEALEKLGG